jgi:hypothetical protein
VICTFLGAILCISTAQYNKHQPAVPEEDDGEYIYPDEEDDE